MGTSTNATMQATEDQTARFTGSSTNARKARMPPKAKTITAVVVSLGSQSRSEEHTSELQSRLHLVCRLLLEKKKKSAHTNATAEDDHPHLAHRVPRVSPR